MNKEDYVSLEVAKLLKEKGFDECCGAYYHCNWDEMTEEECFEVAPIHVFRNSNNRYRIGAPTLYEAQKWLREEHLLYVDVQAYYTSYEVDENDYRDQERLWEYSIWEDATYEVYEKVKSKCSYDTYEKALNAGILEALKLI